MFKSKKSTLLKSLVLLSLCSNNVCFAIEDPTPGVYDEFVEFGKDNGYGVISSIYLEGVGIESPYYFDFKEGALINGSNLSEAAINMEVLPWGEGPVEANINIGENKDFTIISGKDYDTINPDSEAYINITGGGNITLIGSGKYSEGFSTSVMDWYDPKEAVISVKANNVNLKNNNGEMIGAGIVVYQKNIVDIDVKNNYIADNLCGIYMQSDNGYTSNTSINAGKDIIINAHKLEEGTFGIDGRGVFLYSYPDPDEVEDTKGNTNISLTAGNDLKINADLVGIYAEGNIQGVFSGKNVDIIGKDDAGIISEGVGNIEIISTDYVNIDGKNNGILLVGNKEADSKEQNIMNITSNQVKITSGNKAVWASGDSGVININGAVNIKSNYQLSENAEGSEEQHIAIVAGIADKDDIVSKNSEVNVNLQGGTDSIIKGDIIGARDGIVNIVQKNYSGNLKIYGDILAGNGRSDNAGVQSGIVNVDLGNNGYFEGRTDDYQDADIKSGNTFYNPHFSNGTVETSGQVNLYLGNNSYWNVTGQSWVTKLDGNGIIDLRGAGTGGHAIHIGSITGENTFIVNLDPEEVASGDMIYVKEGTGAKQTLYVANEQKLLNLQEGERIRFATIANAGGGFEYGGEFGDSYVIKDRGIKDVSLTVKYVDMDKEETAESEYKDVGTDEKYNGGTDFGEDKPGNNYVEDVYDKIELGENSQNVYLVRTDNSESEDGNGTADTIVNMSRANYKNAVYMDRLNKRLGEARYIDGDEGMWVRLRHDRIGMKDEFRSMNTMYQLGYDKLDNKDDKGERHIGAAIDYMDGSTSYSNIYGEGETKRWGFWMYDTWLGSKGHYADYVAKFGHMHNEFDIRSMNTGEKLQATMTITYSASVQNMDAKKT